LYVTASGPLEN